MSAAVEAAALALREKQKPLKDKYRSDPSSALVTLVATGTLDDATPLTCSLGSAGAAKKVAGLHAAAGGRGFDASGELCSGDMLLESLVACYGVTIRAVATAMSIPIDGGNITCSADLDFRGTMGVKDPDSPEPPPVGFTNITLSVRVQCGEMYKEQIPKLIELSQRYCVVLQTLKKGVHVETKLGHVGKVGPDARKDEHEHADTAVSGAGNAVRKNSGGDVIPLQ